MTILSRYDLDCNFKNHFQELEQLVTMKACVSVCLLAIQATLAVNVPVIGILAQEAYSIETYFPDEHYDSFIAASYVKFVESSGAKVVPVW